MSQQSFQAAFESQSIHVNAAAPTLALGGCIVDIVRDLLPQATTDELKKQLKAAALMFFDHFTIPNPIAQAILTQCKPMLKPILDNALDAILGLPIEV
jgi:hypothetical protein